MHLLPQRTGEIGFMFTLFQGAESDPNTDIEIAFLAGTTDLFGASPDFVIPLGELSDQLPNASLVLLDDCGGMAIEVTFPAGEQEQGARKLIDAVLKRCRDEYGAVKLLEAELV